MSSSLSQAGLLRSAGLYFTPNDQVEANTTFSITSGERRFGLSQSRSTLTTAGARFEHGLTDQLSWGGEFVYGNGTADLTYQGTSEALKVDGFGDPALFMKAHHSTENMRFHANGIINFKSYASLLASDFYTPLNLSQGGSSFALWLGIEGAIGPATLGADVRGDLWRDSQQVVSRNRLGQDTVYTREGAKQSAFSIFGELNHFKYIKPGLRVQANQIEASISERASHAVTAASLSSRIQMPTQQQLGVSAYGRVRLPARFVLNFELFSHEYYMNSDLDNKIGQSYGLYSNLGYKF